MRITLGNPARAANYFPRKRIEDRILSYLSSGSSLLIAAPRRIGKTSVMYRLYDDDSQDAFLFIHVDVEAIDTADAFFRRLYDAIVDDDALGKWERWAEMSKRVWKQAVSKLRVTVKDISVDMSQSGGSWKAFEALIRNHGPEHPIVLMIDEIPIALENIREKEGPQAMESVMRHLRTLRNDARLSRNVRMILTGSISLEQVLRNYEIPDVINDLARIEIGPLEDAEAITLIQTLAKALNIPCTEDEADELRRTIDFCTPFFIQSAMAVLDECRTGADVQLCETWTERALQKIPIKLDHSLQHQLSRLRKTLKNECYTCAREILNLIAEHGSAERNLLTDLGAKHKVSSVQREVIDVLVSDGYIHNAESEKIYQFNSPFMRVWWRQYGTR